jgi:hypothetical protein
VSAARVPDREQAGAGGQPLAGRVDELARLAGWLGNLSAGHGAAVLVEGEPGIGKSALLRAGLEPAAAAGCSLFWGSLKSWGRPSRCCRC